MRGRDHLANIRRGLFQILHAITRRQFAVEASALRGKCPPICVAIFATISVLCLPSGAFADPQSPPTLDQVGVQDPNYNDGDFTRPETSAALRLEFRKSSGAISSTEREREILQYNSKLKLNDDSTLATQIQIPFVEKTTLSEPSSLESAAGLSDAIFQAALIRTISNRWAYGFGARLVAPTETDSVGTDRWQIMPAAGVRYSFLEINLDTYFVPVVRYAISIGGNPSARTIREPQIAPTLNIGLPDGWFVTLYPSNNIRVNCGTPISGQSGRLFLPFDAAIGRTFSGGLTVSLEGSVPIVRDYPVYDFKTELKATLRF